MIAGIVCEYNPMHNGHIHHIRKTKQAGADFVVAVMSGNFVQRGECACIDKWQRAELAVRNGADVVIDLPVPWATGSAESFARGSISLLSSMAIDVLSFGSESEDEKLLYLCAGATENEKVGDLIKKYTAQGQSYPSALCSAVGEIYGDAVQSIISSPNSTLAAEYIRQLNIYAPGCDILPVRRVGADHDADKTTADYASASRIRAMLGEDIFAFVPKTTLHTVEKNLKEGTVHAMENADRAVLSALREMKKEEYASYVTDDNGLISRIYESVKTATTLNELYEAAKSKNYTHARVRREVLNLYLKTEKELSKYVPPYIRILAVNERGLSLLSRIKEKVYLPVVTRHADMSSCDDFAQKIYNLQCSSTDKFALMSERVRPCGMEQRSSMIIVRD